MKFYILLSIVLSISVPGRAEDILVKFRPNARGLDLTSLATPGTELESLGNNWIHLETSSRGVNALRANFDVELIQPNYKVRLIEDYVQTEPEIRRYLEGLPSEKINGKPDIPAAVITPDRGPDPLLVHQWGLQAIHAPEAWSIHPGDKNLVVAVIDTGVDYRHEDLQGNMWQNPGEIFGNGIDDDGNGFVDDIIGWDFVDNDNKPYDVKSSLASTLLRGGNPGHGTHCAGTIGAVGVNSMGISGVVQNVSLMALRTINEKGRGTTAQAVKAIHYAVKNGAKIISASWGTEGENPHEDNRALKEVITEAKDHDVLFVAPAGDGRRGRGYDNDLDSRPAMPASYKIDNIVSVAALNQKNELGRFSNWGKNSVHLAAPGVRILSTIEGNKYSDSILNLSFAKIPWTGTGVAVPFVAGAAALIWSVHPDYKYTDVKKKLIETSTPLPSLQGKIASGGVINLKEAVK